MKAFVTLFAAQVAYGSASRRAPRATRALVLLMLATAVAEARHACGWAISCADLNIVLNSSSHE